MIIRCTYCNSDNTIQCEPINTKFHFGLWLCICGKTFIPNSKDNKETKNDNLQ